MLDGWGPVDGCCLNDLRDLACYCLHCEIRQIWVRASIRFVSELFGPAALEVNVDCRDSIRGKVSVAGVD